MSSDRTSPTFPPCPECRIVGAHRFDCSRNPRVRAATPEQLQAVSRPPGVPPDASPRGEPACPETHNFGTDRPGEVSGCVLTDHDPPHRHEDAQGRWWDVHRSQPAPTPNDRPAVWDLVIADMRDRDRVGRERYGTPLQPFNGRDALVDAYQELLDGAVYLRQAIEERAAPTPPIASPALTVGAALALPQVQDGTHVVEWYVDLGFATGWGQVRRGAGGLFAWRAIESDGTRGRWSRPALSTEYALPCRLVPLASADLPPDSRGPLASPRPAEAEREDDHVPTDADGAEVVTRLGIDVSKWAAEVKARCDAAAPGPAAPEPCTGMSAGWCHNCGDCICERDSDGEWEAHDAKCPLHGDKSTHGTDDPGSPFCVAPARPTSSADLAARIAKAYEEAGGPTTGIMVGRLQRALEALAASRGSK